MAEGHLNLVFTALIIVWFRPLIQSILLEVTKGTLSGIAMTDPKVAQNIFCSGAETFLRICFSLASFELMLVKGAPTSYFSI